MTPQIDGVGNPGPTQEPVIRLSDTDLKAGYWWVTNKQLLQKLVKSFVVLLIVIFWGLAAWGGWQYYIETDLDARLQNNLSQSVDARVIHSAMQPDSLIVLNTAALPAGEGKWDFYAQLANTNDRWAASSVDYSIISGGALIVSGNTYLNPGETKLALSLGNELDTAPTFVELRINNINWKRVWNPGELPDVLIETTDITFTPGGDEILGRSRVNFQAANNTPYNFRDLVLQVELYNEDQIVGVGDIVIADFPSITTQDVEVSWLHKLPKVDSVLVHSHVDLLNPESTRRFTP